MKWHVHRRLTAVLCARPSFTMYSGLSGSSICTPCPIRNCRFGTDSGLQLVSDAASRWRRTGYACNICARVHGMMRKCVLQVEKTGLETATGTTAFFWLAKKWTSYDVITKKISEHTTAVIHLRTFHRPPFWHHWQWAKSCWNSNSKRHSLHSDSLLKKNTN